MANDTVLARIEAWQASGLIDAQTADRLRAAEAGAVAGTLATQADEPRGERPSEGSAATGFGAFFGPTVTIGEVFGYLGAAFLLAALAAFVARIANSASEPELVGAIGAGLEAGVLTVLAFVLRRGDAARQRAAGVALLVAVVEIAAAAGLLGQQLGLAWPGLGIAAALTAVIAAVAFRVGHPSVLTQLALLGALTGLASSSIVWLQGLLMPAATNGGFAPAPLPSPAQQALVVVGSAAWWLAFAVILGWLGLREAGSAEADPGASRRAVVTRTWAGFVAVLGLVSAVTQSAYDPVSNENVRFLAPWIGDLAILALSAVLVERGFRRHTGSYVFAAALGVIIALSDLNVQYVSTSTEIALLVEGVILLAVGLGADQLRRRVGRQERGSDPGGADPPLASATGS